MDETSRRKFLLPIIAVGAALIVLTVAFYRQIVSITFRLFSPRIDISAETAVDAGPVARFREPRVYTNLKVSHGIWVIHEPGGNVFALRSVCTLFCGLPRARLSSSRLAWVSPPSADVVASTRRSSFEFFDSAMISMPSAGTTAVCSELLSLL